MNSLSLQDHSTNASGIKPVLQRSLRSFAVEILSREDFEVFLIKEIDYSDFRLVFIENTW